MDNSASADMTAFVAEATAVSNVSPEVSSNDTVNTSNSNKFYTDEDLARVRTQEKDKLYPQINNLKEELDALKREREEEAARRAANEAALANAAAEEEKRKQEEELGLRDLLKVKESEWAEQLEREREARETAFALLERERAFSEIQAYRAQRLNDEAENIIPDLIDLVNGDSIEEIEKSIQGLKAKSSSILEGAQQAMQAARRDMPGTRVTTPVNAGPLDVETGTRQFSAEDISSMSLNDYAKYRQQLLSPNAQGKSKGLFG